MSEFGAAPTAANVSSAEFRSRYKIIAKQVYKDQDSKSTEVDFVIESLNYLALYSFKAIDTDSSF